MELLDGPVRAYEWGSSTVIPELLGRPSTGEPAAELWLGAHPAAPALVGRRAVPLHELVAADPVAALGPEAAARFGELPFLMKVLAAAAPLSLQAHPSAEQAAAGFAREEAEGVPRDAPHRSFQDPHHKPELICALTDFEALCGFRDPQRTLSLLATLDTDALDPVRERLTAPDARAALHGLLEWLLTLEAQAAEVLVDAVLEAAGGGGTDEWAAEREAVVALGRRYGGDAGVVTALLLNRVALEPGEALFLGAGNLHAYLRGAGVEVMASSDNVLRGGLTPKHVDVETLLQIVDTVPIVPEVQRPPVVDGVAVYDTPVPEFSLMRVHVDGSSELPGGPCILLCVEGRVELDSHVLDRGSAAWVPAEDGAVVVHGRGTVFRTGLGSPVGAVH